MERAAERLAGLGPAAVLIKGAGLQGLKGVDLLWWNGQIEWLRSSPIDTPHTHGSGCTLSAAITAHLARGWELRPAIRAAKTFVEGGLRHSSPLAAARGRCVIGIPCCHAASGRYRRDCSGSGSTTRRSSSLAAAGRWRAHNPIHSVSIKC